MKNMQKSIQKYGTYVFYSLAPLAVITLLAVVPVSRAADNIPDNTVIADVTVPSDVDNVQAVAGDSSITLNWNVATDNVAVKGYKIYYGVKSVSQDGDTYTLGPVDAGNKITYTIDKLTNGTKYYFAVTAYDAANNESTNFSLEASATPVALKGAADNQAPKVSKALALDKNHVQVTFSEAVTLPSANAQNAFSVKSDTTGVQLIVGDASMSVVDSTNKTVVLTTDTQEPGMSYILTAGIDIKDMAGNPIVSGTSDTAAFTGTDASFQANHSASTAVGPQLLSVQAPDSTHVEIVFSVPVVLKADPRENFIITEAQNTSNTLEISDVALSATGARVTLTTAPQQATAYNLFALDVSDSQGNMISSDNNATTFNGSGAAVQPTQQGTQQGGLSPEDATNFTAKMLKELIATLAWTKSLNSAGDLASYILYMSTDGKSYDKGTAVNPTATTFDVTDLVPGVKYFFKLTAKNAAGMESKGVVTTFILPGTGPELGFLLLGSMGLGRLLKRKNKKMVKRN